MAGLTSSRKDDMAKARATNQNAPAYVPPGMDETPSVAQTAEKTPQVATPSGDSNVAAQPGNSLVPSHSPPATEMQSGEARGTVLLEMPELASIEPGGYVPEHFAARLRTCEGIALKQLVASLKAAKARLVEDREPLVLSNSDAIRYLLQRLYDAWNPEPVMIAVDMAGGSMADKGGA